MSRLPICAYDYNPLPFYKKTEKTMQLRLKNVEFICFFPKLGCIVDLPYIGHALKECMDFEPFALFFMHVLSRLYPLFQYLETGYRLLSNLYISGYNDCQEDKMRRSLLALCLLPVVAVGCTTLRFTQDTVSSVLCSDIKDKAPQNITNTFDLSGRVYLYCSFHFDDSRRYLNQRIPLSWKWYNGDKVVAHGSDQRSFSTSPFTQWFYIQTLSIGVGKCHVELYTGDTLIASKEFEIVEKLPADSTTPKDTSQ